MMPGETFHDRKRGDLVLVAESVAMYQVRPVNDEDNAYWLAKSDVVVVVSKPVQPKTEKVTKEEEFNSAFLVYLRESNVLIAIRGNKAYKERAVAACEDAARRPLLDEELALFYFQSERQRGWSLSAEFQTPPSNIPVPFDTTNPKHGYSIINVRADVLGLLGVGFKIGRNRGVRNAT